MRRYALTGSISSALDVSSLEEEVAVSLETSLTDCILRISEGLLRKVLGRGVTVAGSASVRFLLGCGVALEEVLIVDLSESDGGLGLVADCMCRGRMRLEETELVMLVMLVREGRSCAGFARGVARIGSFSASGVACLAAAFAMTGGVATRRSRGRLARRCCPVRCCDAMSCVACCQLFLRYGSLDDGGGEGSRSDHGCGKKQRVISLRIDFIENPFVTAERAFLESHTQSNTSL